MGPQFLLNLDKNFHLLEAGWHEIYIKEDKYNTGRVIIKW